jgi:hypothetical protein
LTKTYRMQSLCCALFEGTGFLRDSELCVKIL